MGSLCRLPRLRIRLESARKPNGNITSMDDAFAESRVREIRLPGSTWRRAGNGTMEWRVRHRQPKGTETDGPHLDVIAPASDPTGSNDRRTHRVEIVELRALEPFFERFEAFFRFQFE